MLRFKTITLRNFLSFGNIPTIIQLDRPGTTLIIGEDLDNTERGTGANGCGKTVIINALSYSVYDKPISNISKDNLVNNINKKNMEVTIEFESNNKTYIIRRVRKSKSGAAGNYVQLFEGERDITPDSVGNTNILIEKIVGFPYELFVRVVAFSANHTPFLDLPVRSHYAANQTDIIEELFDLKTLSEKAVLLKEHIKETESSIQTQMNRIDMLEREHNRHNNQISSAETRVGNWQSKNKKEIVDIQRKLKRVEETDIEEQKALHLEMESLGVQWNDALTKQKKHQGEIRKLNKVIKDKKIELSHLNDSTCPYCFQPYEDSETKIIECERTIEDSDDTSQNHLAELELIQTLIKDLETKNDTVKSKVIVNDIYELLEIKSKADQYQNKLKELKKATNPFIEPLEEIQAVEIEPINKEKINELTSLLDHQKFLLKLLTRKDSFVRKALLNKNIPFLNQRLLHYLNELGLAHSVEFTHEMTANISQFGRPLDFGNLSNGQRARVNIALSFAFRDVLQSLRGRVNICMLDEVLDVGLDTVGINNACKMLKRKARDEDLSLYIISHRDEIEGIFDRKMIIQMSKGFSYAKDE